MWEDGGASIYNKEVFVIEKNLITIGGDSGQTLDIRGKLRKTGTSDQTISISMSAASPRDQWIYNASSSKRYKKVQRDLSEQDVLPYYNIQPVIAKYKEGYLDEDDQRYEMYYPMFIAEDVFKYYPEAVNMNEDGLPENWNVLMN